MAIGNYSMVYTVSGYQNIGIGNYSLENCQGNDNIGIGEETLRYNLYGIRNIGIGPFTLTQNIEGNENIGIGNNVLNANLSGNYNIGIGTQTLYNCKLDSNIGIGEQANVGEDVSGAVQIGTGQNLESDSFQFKTVKLADTNGLAINAGTGVSITKSTTGIIIDATVATSKYEATYTTVNSNSANWEKVNYDSPIITATAGENLSAGNACYLKSDSKYYKASGLSATMMPAVVMAYENIIANNTGRLLRRGDMTNTGWNFTTGSMIYVSDVTAGSATSTTPSGSLHQVQQIGYASGTSAIYFNPQLLVMELT
jgi:hypothetical protein